MYHYKNRTLLLRSSYTWCTRKCARCRQWWWHILATWTWFSCSCWRFLWHWCPLRCRSCTRWPDWICCVSFGIWLRRYITCITSCTGRTRKLDATEEKNQRYIMWGSSFTYQLKLSLSVFNLYNPDSSDLIGVHIKNNYLKIILYIL